MATGGSVVLRFQSTTGEMGLEAAVLTVETGIALIVTGMRVSLCLAFLMGLGVR